MDAASSLTDNLPLTETTLLILLSLSEETRHGYAIMIDVEQLSGGRVRFSTGTLYGALRRLLADHWIERVTEHQGDSLSDERNRKYYALTQTGKQILKLELKRLGRLMRVAGQRVSEMTA
jgi:DNA-binding PadR family transcriptional regulator